jgi:hypothetical protein
VTRIGNLDDAETIMRAQAAAGGVLATLGARDPGLPRLARRLAVSG